MKAEDYLRMLVEDIHSSVIATIDGDGRPETRVIDMMLHDKEGVYFLTAKGKAFHARLMEQGYIALSATKDKVSVSLRGKVRSIGQGKLDEIFSKNTYMREIYPGDTSAALEVFCVYEAEGEYFDISEPGHVVRDSFTIGNPEVRISGYSVGEGCVGCKLCYSVCPQRCIDISAKPVVISQDRCLRCGRCAEICPAHAVMKRA